MATMEFVQKRIDGKEKELEKLNKKLERIYKAQESKWENNPYLYDEDDLRRTKREIEAAASSLKKYTDQLQTMQEKEASRNIPVLLEFLEMWKERCRNHYRKALPEYIEELQDYKEKKRIYDDLMQEIENRARPFYWLHLKHDDPIYIEGKTLADDFREYQKNFNAIWGDLISYLKNPKGSNPEIDWDALSKNLDREANRKYDFIIERTNAIVGTITDASDLKIGAKNDLNGLIIGDRGTAKVQTVGAGGYNIQCFHFRTMIQEYDRKKKKDRKNDPANSR